MATVTGFTAERMLEIENSTVVDGEVQGDNLVLLQRDGTPIDAGSVRGPAGTPGTQGPPGVIGSVNDQALSAVYAPRIFASKSALDAGWPSATRGAVAVTVDEECVWQKGPTTWILLNTLRVFANATQITTRWPNPPAGSIALTTDNDTLWYKFSNTTSWTQIGETRVFTDTAELGARWVSPPNGAKAFTLADQAEWLRIGGIWQLAPSVRAYASQSERDARWTNPPNGALCTTPNILWHRIAGVWKANGPLWAYSGRNAFVPPNGPVYDWALTIPSFDVPTTTTVTAVMYAGYAGTTVNAQGSIYTNSAVGGDNGALMSETPTKAIPPGTWGKMGTAVLTYPLAVNQAQATFLRMYWTGSSYCYLDYTWSIVVNPY